MPRRTRTQLISQKKVRGQAKSKGETAIPVNVLRIAGAAYRQWTQQVTA